MNSETFLCQRHFRTVLARNGDDGKTRLLRPARSNPTDRFCGCIGQRRPQVRRRRIQVFVFCDVFANAVTKNLLS